MTPSPVVGASGVPSMLGLFSDEPDLVDDVCRQAYAERAGMQPRDPTMNRTLLDTDILSEILTRVSPFFAGPRLSRVSQSIPLLERGSPFLRRAERSGKRGPARSSDEKGRNTSLKKWDPNVVANSTAYVAEHGRLTLSSITVFEIGAWLPAGRPGREGFEFRGRIGGLQRAAVRPRSGADWLAGSTRTSNVAADRSGCPT